MNVLSRPPELGEPVCATADPRSARQLSQNTGTPDVSRRDAGHDGGHGGPINVDLRACAAPTCEIAPAPRHRGGARAPAVIRRRRDTTRRGWHGSSAALALVGCGPTSPQVPHREPAAGGSHSACDGGRREPSARRSVCSAAGSRPSEREQLRAIRPPWRCSPAATDHRRLRRDVGCVRPSLVAPRPTRRSSRSPPPGPPTRLAPVRSRPVGATCRFPPAATIRLAPVSQQGRTRPGRAIDHPGRWHVE
jgi:hypothetical protein